MRKLACAVVAAAFVVGCSPGPAQTPAPAPSPSEAASTAPSTEPAPEAPAPTAVPTRDVVRGGVLSATLGEENVPFSDVQCDLSGGFSVLAQGSDLTSVIVDVDDAGLVTEVVITLPDGSVGMVNTQAGSATFTGDSSGFRLEGEAATMSPGGDGAAPAAPLVITGTCTS